MEKNVGEEERLIEGSGNSNTTSAAAVLDFDVLCSTVVLQSQNKWGEVVSDDVDVDDDDGVGFGAVLRMWEGQVLGDCFDDRRIAIQSACCPCYRFGKNMKRAGFGTCFGQGTVYFTVSIGALLNLIAFIVTGRHCFLYVAVALAISLGAYMGFFRGQIEKKFNIVGSDSSLDDCIYHLICPCCTLAQESRTLEMNNVQDGIWHGRGDTLCIGSFSEGRKAFFGLNPPPVSIKYPDPCIMQKSEDVVIPLPEVVIPLEEVAIPFDDVKL